MSAGETERSKVERLLGRPARGGFEVVVRRADGAPVVIRNAPLLDDGTPMPTRYWLVGEPERTEVGRLESTGGVDAAEAEVDADELAAAHERYRAERDAALPPGHEGPRPSGGVAGTRVGVKCLHAHYAWFLAGGDDPVGRWVHDRLAGPARSDPQEPQAHPEPQERPEPRGHPDRVADALRPPGSVEQMSERAIAALDMGTNSTRLLIGSPTGDGDFTTLVRRNTITRLGQGVDATGALAPEAVARVVDCLRDYQHDLEEHGVEQLRVAATSAARDASNREGFFDQVEAVLGQRPELLRGDEEGHLSFVGATRGMPEDEGPFLVVDIGGGSTEFVIGPNPNELEGVLSVDVGCVRLTEKFLLHDPPEPEELSAAISVVDTYLEDVRRELPGVSDARTLVGVAGTITTVAAVELGLATYDPAAIHHFHLTRDAAEDVFRTLATESRAERIHNPGLEEARADVIVGGCCVLVAILRRFGFDELVVSEADILDGLVLSLV